MNVKKLHNQPYSFPGNLVKVIQRLKGYSPFHPLIVQLILTHKCNIKCHYCYQKRDSYANTTDMTLSFVEKLHENLKSSFLFKPLIYLTGGEPTTCSDFLSILKCLDRKKYSFFFCSNGTGLTSIYSELSDLKHLDNIIISHHNITQKEILSFLELCAKDKKRKFSISINCPVYELVTDRKDPQAELYKIIKTYERHPVSYISLQHPIYPDYDDEELLKSVMSCYNFIENKKNNIQVFFFPEIKKEDLSLYYSDNDFPYNKKNCIYPWLITVVKPDGNVIACDETNTILGNIFKTKFNHIWNGKQYRMLRKNIYSNGICFKVCERCCRREYR